MNALTGLLFIVYIRRIQEIMLYHRSTSPVSLTSLVVQTVKRRVQYRGMYMLFTRSGYYSFVVISFRNK